MAAGIIDETDNVKEPPEASVLRLVQGQMGDNGEIDTTSYEGYLMKSFVEKYQLTPTFLDAGWGWGILDKKTNLWNGMVGNVS